MLTLNAVVQIQMMLNAQLSRKHKKTPQTRFGQS